MNKVRVTVVNTEEEILPCENVVGPARRQGAGSNQFGFHPGQRSMARTRGAHSARAPAAPNVKWFTVAQAVRAWDGRLMVSRKVMAQTTPPFQTFAQFYPSYLSEHADRTSGTLPMAGSLSVLALLGPALATGSALWLLPMPLAGYGFARIVHFVFQKNKPASHHQQDLQGSDGVVKVGGG